MVDSSPTDPEELVAKIKSSYLMIKPEDITESIILSVPKESVYLQTFLELSENLRSTIIASTVPFLLIRQSVYNERLQTLISAERIRSINAHDVLKFGPSHKISEDNEKAVINNAIAQISEELIDPDKIRWFSGRILNQLSQFLSNGDTSSACQELILQGTVGVWTAFETFAKNFAKAYVNKNPNEGVKLLSSDLSKSYFGGGKASIPAEILSNHDFNLQDSFGDAIFSYGRIDSLSAIEATLKVLFPENHEIGKKVKSRNLYRLSQDRNLIVHNRGVIDRAYNEKIDKHSIIGNKIHVSGNDLDSYLNAVGDVAKLLARIA